MWSEYLDARTIYLILHIFGLILGAGGAYMSDLMFFRSIKDRTISQTEFGFLRLGSNMVWTGIVLLVVSGALLFSLDPAGYLASGKFLLKMTVVLIIIINGFVFHYMHLPVIKGHIDKHFPNERAFMKKSPLLIASGAVSMTSWTAAFILGVLRGMPYTYVQGLLIYLAVVAVAVTVGIVFRKRFLG